MGYGKLSRLYRCKGFKKQRLLVSVFPLTAFLGFRELSRGA